MREGFDLAQRAFSEGVGRDPAGLAARGVIYLTGAFLLGMALGWAFAIFH